MSQWTHFLGVIRYESMLSNVWPEPADKGRQEWYQVEHVHSSFQRATPIPTGSEGPISFETILTSRGPTVIITGDLRDFGEDEVQSVVDWLNEVDAIGDPHETHILMVRDAMIYCDVEYKHDGDLFIMYDHEARKFALRQANKINK